MNKNTPPITGIDVYKDNTNHWTLNVHFSDESFKVYNFTRADIELIFDLYNALIDSTVGGGRTSLYPKFVENYT